jgi:hypothetical protein
MRPRASTAAGHRLGDRAEAGNRTVVDLVRGHLDIGSERSLRLVAVTEAPQPVAGDRAANHERIGGRASGPRRCGPGESGP